MGYTLINTGDLELGLTDEQLLKRLGLEAASLEDRDDAIRQYRDYERDREFWEPDRVRA